MVVMDPKATLAREVKRRRFQLGIETAKDFAKQAGISERLVSDIENGKRDSYLDRSLWNIDKILGWDRGVAKEILEGKRRSADGEVYEDDNVITRVYHTSQGEVVAHTNAYRLNIEINDVVETSDLLSNEDYEDIVRGVSDAFRAIVLKKKIQVIRERRWAAPRSLTWQDLEGVTWNDLGDLSFEDFACPAWAEGLSEQDLSEIGGVSAAKKAPYDYMEEADQ